MLPHPYHGNLPLPFSRQMDMLKWERKHNSTADFCIRQLGENITLRSCIEEGYLTVLCLC